MIDFSFDFVFFVIGFWYDIVIYCWFVGVMVFLVGIVLGGYLFGNGLVCVKDVD